MVLHIPFNQMLPKHKHVKMVHTDVQMIISFAALIRSIVRTDYVVGPLADSHHLFINDNYCYTVLEVGKVFLAFKYNFGDFAIMNVNVF